MGLNNETRVFDNLRTTLIEELAQKKILDNPDIMLPEGSPDTPSLQRMLEKCHCEVCDREAPRGSIPWLHIQKVMNRPRRAMLTSDSFVQFYGDIQKITGRYETTIPCIADDFRQYMDALELLDKNIEQQENVVEQRGNEMALLGTGDTTPEADRITLSSYNNAKKTQTDKTEEIQALTGKIKIWGNSLKNVRNSLSKKQNNTQVIRAEKLYTDMQAVADMFAETKERIFKTIVVTIQRKGMAGYQASNKA